MIHYGYRIFIDKKQTTEILRLEHDDTLYIVYTKNQEFIFTTHHFVNGSYKFDVKINDTAFSVLFDLNLHLGLQSSSNSPIEIHNVDKFAETAIGIIGNVNNYLERKKSCKGEIVHQAEES